MADPDDAQATPPAPPREVPAALRWFVSLSRRVRTLIIGGLLFVVLLILTMTLPVPYVVLSPGPTYNTLGTDDSGNTIIVIDGTKTNKTHGNLNLTTVEVSAPSTNLTVFDALKAWLAGDEDVVPTSSIYTPGVSEQQVNQQNTAEFAGSQDSAVAAAACELGYPKGFGVLGVVAKGPSKGVLQPGDIFVSVAGRPTTSYDRLKAVLARQQPGATVPVVVTRAGSRITGQVKLGPAPGKAAGAGLGVQVNSTASCLFPFTVDLGLGNQIGGPSAGTMFALGIIDEVGKKDLTDGKFIAGTGTIDAKGNVGAIGGIQLKMIAARKAGATVFLAPAGNCGDVRGATPSGLQVVKISTLHQAVQELLALRKGTSAPGC